MKFIQSRCPDCKGKIEFPFHDLNAQAPCPICGASIYLTEPLRWWFYPLFGLGAIYAAFLIIGTIVTFCIWLSRWHLFYKE